ncbi:MAG: type IV toxin-antitoxin system AbiEi family antitoxin domain-containing protein [Actinomycetota bacterium]|nr:type IV toxin-antitoxin system AbiEi family antitoxin domain-containing protein [Actinomycetota bacterium]
MEFDQGLGRLARVARAQGGVFSVRQARLAGLSRQQIDYRRRPAVSASLGGRS